MKHTERIVAFCDFSNHQDLGILLTLGIDYRSHPFVTSFLYDREQRPRLNAEAPFLYISKDAFGAEPMDAWSVLLVSDQVGPDQLPDDHFDSRTHIMYHTRPIRLLEFLGSRTVGRAKQGSHETISRRCGYPLLNHLVDAYDDDTGAFVGDKFEAALVKLIDWFRVDEVLETKLEFLHLCLLPATSPETLPDELSDLGTEFEKFVQDRGAEWSSEQYIGALATFRRAVLGS